MATLGTLTLLPAVAMIWPWLTLYPSYCNSILQCLYYSSAFRKSVINFPKRTPIETLEAALSKNLKYQSVETFLEAEAAAAKARAAAEKTVPRSPGAPPNQPQKPEDKDSPEYKKKVALQTLPLLDVKDNSASYGMNESLFTSLKDIFESVVASQSKFGVIRPQHFLDVLRRDHEMFRSAMHQDAHEFLNLLLNEVVANVESIAASQPPAPTEPTTEAGDSEQTATVADSTTSTVVSSPGSETPNTSRWVHELFEGTLTSETQCLTCENVSQRDEVFFDLSVDLEQHSSVTSCLRKFSAEEMLCERNKFHCDNCGGLQEAEKRMKIKRLPRILALHLKRFKYTEDLQRLQKLFHRVVYPYHLRLFNTTDDAEDADRLYELYAVVVHIGGGPHHGHYVSIIKTEDHGWLLFDDEMVEPVDKSYVRNFFGDRPGLACAYVLFYQETTLEAVQRELEQDGIGPETTSTVGDTVNGVPTTPLEHVRSEVLNGENGHQFSPLRHAPTAPVLSTKDNPLSTSPPVPPIPTSSGINLRPKKSDVQSKKERAREEKERKAAEKEKEKAEKQKRKEMEFRRKEALRNEEAQLKAALEASKRTKAEEDSKRAETERAGEKGDKGEKGEKGDKGDKGENGAHKPLSGLDRFKRGSKSISSKLVTHERRRAPSFEILRSRETRSTEIERAKSPHQSTTMVAPSVPSKIPELSEVPLSSDTPSEAPQSAPVPESPQALSQVPATPPPKSKPEKGSHHNFHKWKTFGLRKKSFSLTS